MNEQFWRDKWTRGETPFHQSEINERLLRFFPEHLADARSVLVPLSGKSRDLLWLLENTAAEIVASEWVEQAVRSFHDKSPLRYSRREVPPFVLYDAGRLKTYVGNFLALPDAIEERFAAVYDRGALVALPPDDRPAYARCIERLTVSGAGYLLLALEYDPESMAGPPHPLTRPEIESLFGTAFSVETLLRVERDDHMFRENGVGDLTETTYLLRRV